MKPILERPLSSAKGAEKMAEDEKNGASEDISLSDVKDESAESEGKSLSQENGQAEDGKKKQSREENARYAEMRRAQKAKKEHDAEIERAKKEAVFESEKGYVKPETLKDLGLKEVKDEDDLYLCKEYEKLLAEGDENPEAGAYRSLREKKRSETEEKAKKEKADEDMKIKVGKAQIDFEKKYGLKLADIAGNPDNDFMKRTGRYITCVKGHEDEYISSFLEAYAEYDSEKKAQEAESKERAKKMGSFSTSDGGTKVSDGADDPLKMTHEQFKAYWESKYSG